jgi:NAD(P)-dependent dehydrogenase (short-subunit alcohol dehydrogenase family)
MGKTRLRTFKDAVTIITGGASGIGRALGAELAKRGAEVTLADLQIELASEAADSIKEHGGKAESALLDVTDHAAVKKLVKDIYLKKGRIDYIFNNAGIAVFGESIQYSHEDWENVLNVFTGYCLCCHAEDLVNFWSSFYGLYSAVSLKHSGPNITGSPLAK